MLHRSRSIDRFCKSQRLAECHCLLASSAKRHMRALLASEQWHTRGGMTLLELVVAMTIMVMVVVALGGLTRTVQQGFEYSEGYGVATQHARVVLDRIAQNVCQATANDQFPGCIVVAETVNSYSLPGYAGALAAQRIAGQSDGPAAVLRAADLLSEPRQSEPVRGNDGPLGHADRARGQRPGRRGKVRWPR